MSNNDDTNEYLRNILAQYLQQQQAAAGGNEGGAQGDTSSNIPGHIHLQPPTPSVQAQAQPSQDQGQQKHQHDINALLASYMQATSSTAGTAASALPQEQRAFANQINTLQHAQPFQQQSQAGQGDHGGAGNVLVEQILSSVQRLAAINPALASAAVNQALGLRAHPTPHDQGQQGLSQQGLGNLQPQIQGLQLSQVNQPHGLQLLANQSQQLSGSPTSHTVAVSNPPMLPTAASAGPSIVNFASGVMGQGAAAVSLNTHSDNVLFKQWTAEQLEAHVQKLRESAQPIPQSIAILVATARRKEEQYNAKKLANRLSAHSSRERKKAKISAMAQDNVKLKRESLILKSLPDPVVAINPDGEITFINEQVKRMLVYDTEDLIGSRFDNFVAMDCRDDFWKMVNKVHGSQTVLAKESGRSAEKEVAKQESSRASSGSDPNVMSLRSTEPGGMAHKKRGFEAEPKSSTGVSESVDESDVPPAAKQAKLEEDVELKSPPELLQQIRPALRPKYVSTSGASSSLDSSLGKVTRKSPTSSESGYRESNDSPEESNERSSSVMSNEDMNETQKKTLLRTNPLAPSCIVNLIRRDFSFVWCELTASLRSKPEVGTKTKKSKRSKEDLSELNATEVLICMRPLSGSYDEASVKSSRTSKTYP